MPVSVRETAQAHANRLCSDLGSAIPVSVEPEHPAAAWARSGAMWLTGAADGPPAVSPGAPASAMRGALAVLHAATGRPVPGVELLGERAALAGLSRQAPWSVGGSHRCVRTSDGWFGLSLPRQSDVELLPALLETDLPRDVWPAVAEWASSRRADVIADRAHLLGLAGSPISTPATRPGVVVTPGGRRRRTGQPVIVDFTSLWAGPLCADLLARAGARVIKVESHSRPDGARRGPRSVFDLLHAGHRSVALDFATQRDVICDLTSHADVVLEASRPRALRQLGIDAAQRVADGTIWCSITAYGREAASRIGFGDDVAAGAGLISWADGVPYPVGDAIADPLAGAHAAAAVAVALRGDHASLIDVSMHDVASAAAALPSEPVDVLKSAAGWGVAIGDSIVPVEPPRSRTLTGGAPALGADTPEVLAQLRAIAKRVSASRDSEVAYELG